MGTLHQLREAIAYQQSFGTDFNDEAWATYCMEYADDFGCAAFASWMTDRLREAITADIGHDAWIGIERALFKAVYEWPADLTVKARSAHEPGIPSYTEYVRASA
jgi:hypothetical protein